MFSNPLVLFVLQLLVQFDPNKYKLAAARKRALTRFVTLKVLAHCLRACRDGDCGDVGDLADRDLLVMANEADALALVP